MPDWKNEFVVLKVPRELAQDLEQIAKRDAPNKRWSAKAKEILYSFAEKHKEQSSNAKD